jgi:surface antigen
MYNSILARTDQEGLKNPLASYSPMGSPGQESRASAPTDVKYQPTNQPTNQSHCSLLDWYNLNYISLGTSIPKSQCTWYIAKEIPITEKDIRPYQATP